MFEGVHAVPARRRPAAPRRCAAAVLFALSAAAVWAQDAYETPAVLNAGAFLSPAALKGAHHTVLDNVQSDGFINSYVIATPFGESHAVSTPAVAIRIHEANAVAAMEQVKATDAFKDAAKSAAVGALEGAKTLVTEPVATVRGAATGVGKFFQRAAQATRLDERSDAQDPAYKSILGLAQAKRQVAEEFGVDVYSSNPILQERLDELARIQFAGGLAVKAPLALTGGAAGAVVSTTQTAAALNQVIARTPPEELRIRNRDALHRMGIDENLTDLFLQNGVFTPRQQTALVASIERMTQTGDRNKFIKFAVGTDSEDLAAFRVRTAEMYASHDRNVDGIAEFIEIGAMVAGRTRNNAVVLITPVDYLLWTSTTAGVVERVEAELRARGDLGERRIWLERASDRSKQELEKRGWKVHESASEKLAATAAVNL